MSATVLITRPETAAMRFADQIRDRWGSTLPIVLSPLMEIRFGQDVPDFTGIKTLVFTSRYGVEAFAKLSTRRDLPCYVVGPATASAAQKLGLIVKEGAGDADSLVAKLLEDRANGPFLHLRGAHVTGNIVEKLRSAGLKSSEHIVYQQMEILLTDTARSLLERPLSVILPVFSPRSAILFFDQVGAPKARLSVVAMSQNVADAVPPDLIERLVVAERPDSPAMLSGIDQLL